MPSPERELLISPFSNSTVRNWPIGHFSRLLGLLVDRLGKDVHVTLVGTAGQRLAASEIVRPHPTARVTNGCGRIAWPQLTERIARAACVVGNNSGVTHLSGQMGVPTVCIFGGSHQRREWRPRGDNVVVVSRVIGCSPCQLDHNAESPYNKACLRLIEPETVAEAVMLVIVRHAEVIAG